MALPPSSLVFSSLLLVLLSSTAGASIHSLDETREGVEAFLQRVRRQSLDNQGSNIGEGAVDTGSIAGGGGGGGFFGQQVGMDWSAPYLGGSNNPNGPVEALYAFGPSFGDRALSVNEQNGQGKLLDFSIIKSLGQGFPYYGGVYNYTWVQAHGFIAFGQAAYTGPLLTIGDEVEWPREPDPALIGPYICQQQIDPQIRPTRQGEPQAGVYFRVVARDENIITVANDPRYNYIVNDNDYSPNSAPGTGFLDTVTRHLREGIVGAYSFKAEVALVVTWHLTISNNIQNIDPSDLSTASTYQMVWTTDADATVSYVIFNYHRLGFASADLNGNNRLGRCRALFNGGNHTGQVPVLPGPEVKDNPISLAQLSSVPPKYRGRYMFRVDDVVLRGGCSNKTEGTVPIMLTPEVVGMVGKTTVDVNGMCWIDRTKPMALYIEGQQNGGPCQRLNAAISRCPLPPLQGWGTKNVYHQPMHSLDQVNRAYVGFLYVAPPGQDPSRLQIGSIPQWYNSPFLYNSRSLVMSWFPLNYTKDMNDERFQENFQQNQNDNEAFSIQAIIQNVAPQLDLLVYGYRESRDEDQKQWNPEHRLLAILKTGIQNTQGGNTIEEMNRMREEQVFSGIPSIPDANWCISIEERRRLIYNYRVGYLQLTPSASGQSGQQGLCDGGNGVRRYGQVSDPISLHWLWPFNYGDGVTGTAPFNPLTESLDRLEEETDRIAADMCMDWYNEDGMADQYFIRTTETNSSCPCKVEYARADLGRFMPHPRCSTAFRSVSCAVTLGSSECYMSATNSKIINYWSGESKSSKHGQVCCYDERGYLMHSNYQSVVQTNKDFPYNPGFPTRAYEFGSEPYTGMYMVPTFSTMTHDVLPYFLCCRYSRERCQLFYWRRPSSGCQEYQEPVTAQIVGAGHFTTMSKRVFTFNGNGVYRLLSIPQPGGKKPIEIQLRMEPFPDRTVKYSIVQQEDLVQPSNASVVTGIAIGGGDIDHVQITARKDTRRFKYRTNVVVRGKLRYFDHMWLQRFNGILIYVNNVRQGKQSDIFVVLQEAQIGLRIRESFGEDFDTPNQYMESYGLLDVTVSAGAESVLREVNEMFNNDPRMNNPDWQARRREPPSGILIDRNIGGGELRFVNDRLQTQVQQRIVQIPEQYVVTDFNSDNLARAFNPLSGGVDYFQITQEDDSREFPAYPLFSKRVYQMDTRFMRSWRPPQTYENFIQQQTQACTRRLGAIGGIGSSNLAARLELQRLASQCRVFKEQIDEQCSSSQAQICQYDMAALYEGRIAKKAQQFQMTFEEELAKIQLHYNSCGAMNIEFPEYLLVTDAQAPKYLVDNTIEYGCYQDSWIKGTTDYECRQFVMNDGTYVNRWNQGWQPWCRSRTQSQTFKAMAAVFGTLLCILAIMAIFCCCWCVKTKRREQSRAGTRASSVSGRKPLPGRTFGAPPPPQPIGQKVALSDFPSRSQGSTVQYEPRDSGIRQSPGFPQALLCILAIMAIFCCCWCVKTKRREQSRAGTRASSVSGRKPLPGRTFGAPPPPQPIGQKVALSDFPSRSQGSTVQYEPRDSGIRQSPGFPQYDLTPGSAGNVAVMSRSRGSSLTALNQLPPAHDSPLSKKSNASNLRGLDTAV